MSRRDLQTLQCPRCRRFVQDNEDGRKAHRVSCVRIPTVLPDDWGVKTKKVERS